VANKNAHNTPVSEIEKHLRDGGRIVCGMHQVLFFTEMASYLICVQDGLMTSGSRSVAQVMALMTNYGELQDWELTDAETARIRASRVASGTDTSFPLTPLSP
jgi:hypothetical protein